MLNESHKFTAWSMFEEQKKKQIARLDWIFIVYIVISVFDMPFF